MANKRLFRSRDDRMVAGVCGGIAEYFEIDPVIVRLIFVALLVTGGVGLAAYIVLWIVTPEEGSSRAIADDLKDRAEEKIKEHQDRGDSRETRRAERAEKRSARRERPNAMLGLVLIVLGALFLFDSFSIFSFDRLWPLLLVAAGLGILLNGVSKE